MPETLFQYFSRINSDRESQFKSNISSMIPWLDEQIRQKKLEEQAQYGYDYARQQMLGAGIPLAYAEQSIAGMKGINTNPKDIPQRSEDIIKSYREAHKAEYDAMSLPSFAKEQYDLAVKNGVAPAQALADAKLKLEMQTTQQKQDIYSASDIEKRKQLIQEGITKPPSQKTEKQTKMVIPDTWQNDNADVFPRGGKVKTGRVYWASEDGNKVYYANVYKGKDGLYRYSGTNSKLDGTIARSDSFLSQQDQKIGKFPTKYVGSSAMTGNNVDTKPKKPQKKATPGKGSNSNADILNKYGAKVVQ